LPKARFLLGQGERGFWISFEALCNEHIRVKLLEGAYHYSCNFDLRCASLAAA
jgi:hypothetical protein